jgi:hypothetical protein
MVRMSLCFFAIVRELVCDIFVFYRESLELARGKVLGVDIIALQHKL